MARKLKRLDISENSGKNDPANSIAKSVNIQLNFIVSSGNDDRERTYEEFIEEIQTALKAIGVNHVTPAGGYYIIDGKVCLPEDYDPETQNRKPGTHPPVWAMTEADRQEQRILERVQAQWGYDKLSRQPPNLRTATETPKAKMARISSQSSPKRRSGYDWDSHTKNTKDLASVAPVTSDEVPELEWDVADIDDDDIVDEMTQNATHQLRTTHKPRTTSRVRRKR